jgi:hypothetical protein
MAGSSLKNHSYQNQFHCVNINRQKTGKSLLKWSGLGWILSRTASIGYSYTENPFRRGSSLGWSIMAGSSLKNHSYQNQFHGVNINRHKTGKSL